MKQLILKFLGTILPRRLLRKWAKAPRESIRWNISDYAPIRRKIM